MLYRLKAHMILAELLWFFERKQAPVAICRQENYKAVLFNLFPTGAP